MFHRVVGRSWSVVAYEQVGAQHRQPLLWCAGLLIYSTSTAWPNIRSLCPKCSSRNAPEREHRNSLRLCAVVLPWQLTIRFHKQTVDNLVVNLSNPDHTAVVSTSWQIQWMPDDVFANVTSFLLELASLLKCFLAYHTLRLHIFWSHRKTVFQTLLQSRRIIHVNGSCLILFKWKNSSTSWPGIPHHLPVI